MMNAKTVSNNVLISTNDVCMLAPMSSTNFLPTLLFKEFKIHCWVHWQECVQNLSTDFKWYQTRRGQCYLPAKGHLR